MPEIETLSNDEYETLLSKYDYKFQKGDLVKGVVCGYDSEGTIVDIGSKTTALVPEREAVLENDKTMKETLEKGSAYEFLIIREEDESGKFLLSYKKVAQAYSWKQLEEVKANDDAVLGTVASVVKGGILVDVAGIRGFVPSSHLKAKDGEFKPGDEIELKILTLDAQQNNFILSNKKVYSETPSNKAEVFAGFEVGKVVNGEVVRITDFGAFIDLGGIDGLLPLSQISWRWVDHPSDVLKVGSKIGVEIIGVDYDKHRVSLSLKNLEPDPWIEAKNQIKDGDEREGVITRIKHFGAFVEVFPGVEALLPINELTEYQNKNKRVLVVGDKIGTTILRFNPEDRRISLGLKSEEETPQKVKTAEKE